MEPQTLTKPPVVFTSLEARFHPTKDVELERLRALAQSLSDRFPNITDIEDRTINFGFGENQQSFHNFQSQKLGVQLTSKSNTRSINFEIDKYSVAFQSGYYPPWPEIRNFFLEYFDKYLETSKQRQLARVGLRVVNRILLPTSERLDFEDYIKTAIPVPKIDEFPEALSSFGSEIVTPFDTEYACRIKQGTEKELVGPHDGGPALGFILDIDAWRSFRSGTDDLSQLNSMLDSTLEKLREMKNIAFFGTFTDKALSEYV